MVGGDMGGLNRLDNVIAGQTVGGIMAQNKPVGRTKIAPKANLQQKKEVWDLRLNGLSYREIESKTGISKSAVGLIIKEKIDEIKAETKAEAKEYIRLELERLDKMLAYWLPKVRDKNWDDPNETPGSPDVATQNVLRIMNRRSKYLGLDKPTQLNVEGKIDLNLLITQSYLPPGQTLLPDGKSLVDGTTITLTESDYGDVEREDVRDPEGGQSEEEA